MAFYICTKCEIRMRPEKNDVHVEEYAGNGPYKIWSADLWKCPSCGIEIIAGFGFNPLVEHFQEKLYADFKKGVTHRILEKPEAVHKTAGDSRIKTCPLCGKPDYTHHVCTTKSSKAGDSNAT